MIDNKARVLYLLDRNCSPNFSLLQDLANGHKHCIMNQKEKAIQSGFGSAPFGQEPWGGEIVVIHNSKAIPLYEILSQYLNFWIKNLYGLI
jgi:hypothetical protein